MLSHRLQIDYPFSQNTSLCNTPSYSSSVTSSSCSSRLSPQTPPASWLLIRHPSRHKPARLTYLPQRDSASAVVETSFHSTLTSCAPQLSTRPVLRPINRSTNRTPQFLHRHNQPNLARQRRASSQKQHRDDLLAHSHAQSATEVSARRVNVLADSLTHQHGHLLQQRHAHDATHI